MPKCESASTRPLALSSRSRCENAEVLKEPLSLAGMYLIRLFAIGEIPVVGI